MGIWSPGCSAKAGFDELCDALGCFQALGGSGDQSHAHASGEDLDGLVERVRTITGRVDLVHANDSRDAQGSGADRHANLGRGLADPEFIMRVITESAAPVIIETKGGLTDHIADLDWIRTRL